MRSGHDSPSCVLRRRTLPRANRDQFTGGLGRRLASCPDTGPKVPLDYWGSALTEALNLMPHIPAYLKDAERRFLWCSEGLVRLTGFQTGSQLLGLRDEDVAPADLAVQYRANEEEVLEHGRRFVGLVELVRKPYGPSTWYISTKLPVRTVDGTIIGASRSDTPAGETGRGRAAARSAASGHHAHRERDAPPPDRRRHGEGRRDVGEPVHQALQDAVRRHSAPVPAPDAADRGLRHALQHGPATGGDSGGHWVLRPEPFLK